LTQPQHPAIPDTSTLHTTTEIHPNTHKDHKTQHSPHCLSHKTTPLPASTFSIILSNYPNFYS
jgi:hypothetical protein